MYRIRLRRLFLIGIVSCSSVTPPPLPADDQIPPNNRLVAPELAAELKAVRGQITVLENGRPTWIGIYEAGLGSDPALSFLKDLSELRRLDVVGQSRNASSEWTASIAALHKLEHITTYRAGLTDDSLRHLSGLILLKSLVIDVSEVTDAGLDALLSLENLEELTLRYTPITERGLEKLARLPRLKVLSLIETDVSPAGIAALRDSSVEELNWYNEDLDRRAPLPYLKELRSLKRLNLTDQGITDQDLDHVRDMMGLKELVLSGHSISDKGLAKLSGLTRLRRLDLSIPDAHWNRHRGDIRDAGLQHLAGMTELRDLNLNGNLITGTGLQHLTGLTRLQHLGLAITPMAGAGIRQLSRLKSVESINLAHSRVRPEVIAELGQLPNLHTLDITGTPLQAAEQVDLRELRSLKKLVAYEFDERKLLVPPGCAITSFD